jgi:uncharacterized protein (TIGR02265 family)
MSVPPVTEPVPAFAFEGLFIRGLEADASLRKALRDVGVDLERLEVNYPNAVFLRCLEVAHKHLYPGRSADEAYAAFGLAFTRGIQSTMLGRVIARFIPLLGPEGYLKRFPSHMKMVSRAQVTAEKTGERAYRIELRGTHMVPAFYAGVLEGGLRFAKAEPTVSARSLGPDSFELLVRWA